MTKRWALLALAVTLVGTAVLAWRLDPASVARSFGRANWWGASLAAIVNVLNTFIESGRWAVIVGGVQPDVRLRHAFGATLVGTVGNVLLPFKLGEGARALALARVERLPFATVISTAIVDRVVDLVVFLVLALMVAIVYPPPAAVMRLTLMGLVTVTIATGILYLVSGAVARARQRRGPGAGGYLSRAWSVVYSALAGLPTTRRLPLAAGLSGLSWVTRALVIWIMLRAFGIDLSLTAAAACLVVINIGVVTVSTPGNLGVFELTTVAALALYGVPPEAALSFAVVLHIAEIVPTMLLGVVAMWALGIPAAELTAVAPARP